MQAPPLPGPRGFGPWCVALFAHTGADVSKRQTEIRIETYPELVPWAHRQSGQQGWTLTISIGPFQSWRDALVFHHQWLQPTRGKTRRIQRGLELLAKWHQHYGLYMWVPPGASPGGTLASPEGERKPRAPPLGLAAPGPKGGHTGKRSRAAMAIDTPLDDLDDGEPSMALVKNVQIVRNAQRRQQRK